MPPIRNSTHRIQRYFSPLVVRTVFKPERLLTPPPMIWTTKFPYEEYGIIPDSETQNMQMRNGSDRSSHALIPKPKGEVTRISRQGYNLCDALGWRSELYNEIQIGLHVLAAEHLDLRKTWTKHSSEAQMNFCIKAKEKYPILGQYAADWVTADFMIIYLRNTSQRKRNV